MLFKINLQTCSQGSKGFKTRILQVTDSSNLTMARTLAVQMGSPNILVSAPLNTLKGQTRRISNKSMSQGCYRNTWLTQVCLAQLITVNCNRMPGLEMAEDLILLKIHMLLQRTAVWKGGSINSRVIQRIGLPVLEARTSHRDRLTQRFLIEMRAR